MFFRTSLIVHDRVSILICSQSTAGCVTGKVSQASDNSVYIQYMQNHPSVIAEHLSARLLIVQCSQVAFVCMYIYISVTL